MRMNKFFTVIIVTIIFLGLLTVLIIGLRVGPPLFKFLNVATIVGIVWGYLILIKQLKNKKKEQ